MTITKEQLFEFDDELDKIEEIMPFLIKTLDKEDAIESTISFLCKGMLIYIPHLRENLSRLLEKIEKGEKI